MNKFAADEMSDNLHETIKTYYALSYNAFGLNRSNNNNQNRKLATNVEKLKASVESLTFSRFRFQHITFHAYLYERVATTPEIDSQRIQWAVSSIYALETFNLLTCVACFRSCALCIQKRLLCRPANATQRYFRATHFQSH